MNVVVDLACMQSKEGHDVAVASAGGEFEALLAGHGVRHFNLDARGTRKLLGARSGYLSIIQELCPDIVHAHTISGVLLASLLRRQAPYATVATVHNEFERQAILMGLADRVIAVSYAVADSLKKRGMANRKIRVVPNGTIGSFRRTQCSGCAPADLCKPAVVTVAGLYKRKGIAELISAFAQLPVLQTPPHLYIVGDGPDGAAFRAQAKAAGIAEFVHFEGFQPEVAPYLLASDVFVLASHREPFGLVLSEAREAGCAIVATQVDGIPLALDGGAAGVLVAPHDVAGLATALTQMIVDDELRQQWKEKAQHNIEWLSVARVAHDISVTYEELLHERGR